MLVEKRNLRHVALVIASWVVGSGIVGWFIAEIIVHEHGSIVYFLGAIFVGLIGALIHTLFYLVSNRTSGNDKKYQVS